LRYSDASELERIHPLSVFLDERAFDCFGQGTGRHAAARHMTRRIHFRQGRHAVIGGKHHQDVGQPDLTVHYLQ
jgi:hypothetical protein